MTEQVEFAAAVDVSMTKWGHRPHWTYSARYLGTDDHGEWLGVPAGTAMSRPGATYTAPVDQVCLVPTPHDPATGGWFATFHRWSAAGSGPGPRTVPIEVYVDISTPPRWDGTTVRAVDLDLDVVRGRSGRVWIDDEDEFAEHRVTLAYPDAVVALALASCRAVQAAATARRAPFDGTAPLVWFTRLDELG